eukprot:CAMPEP_0197626708 /NCGR_PEP_ID=MMETSP1338-20131121/5547_1 /TAXON_ID=43686 ORGANISM="Pelagodinium beii, Strain RCC1491" /NCGR_SAMPLE_ID=MMETSP1338 /ASSEMBLY_ACC=CAM_ASM_000754 /LENGTH=419 /DNA_ID=CAMNT_0043197263 /DNA_START=42 /DNA_END=1299 /DNA_ORIENTATION=-
MADDGQSFQGTIKSFNTQKGYGFIDSPAAGGDLLLLRSELNGFAVQKGDQVAFTVNQTPKGMQATSVQVLPAADGSQAFSGEVKSWNDSKGFGFLTSEAATQVFGKDVFVLKSQFGGAFAHVGAQVEFRANLGDRGPVVVGDVTFTQSPMPGMKGGMGGGGMMGGGMMGGGGGMMGGCMGGGMMGGKGGMMGGKGGMGMGGPMGCGQMGYGQMGGGGMGMMGGGGMGMMGGMGGGMKAPSGDCVYHGTVKQINFEKGWGHITSNALTKILGKSDIFVLKTSIEACPGLDGGKPVSFKITQGNKGPHATDIQIVDSMSANQMFHGTVKSFNAEKGWGFIDSPDAKQSFGSDVFLHKKALNGQDVSPGDSISFSVDLTGGRASANAVTVNGEEEEEEDMAGLSQHRMAIMAPIRTENGEHR